MSPVQSVTYLSGRSFLYIPEMVRPQLQPLAHSHIRMVQADAFTTDAPVVIGTVTK